MECEVVSHHWKAIVVHVHDSGKYLKFTRAARDGRWQFKEVKAPYGAVASEKEKQESLDAISEFERWLN